jgi:hypothetical protein
VRERYKEKWRVGEVASVHEDNGVKLYDVVLHLTKNKTTRIPVNLARLASMSCTKTAGAEGRC